MPKAYALWKIEKPGFRPAFQIWPTWVLRGRGSAQVKLDPDGSGPGEMMRVTVGTAELTIPGLDHLPAVELGDYFIDRHEVTNADYSKFVEAGGYEKREFWAEPFVKEGRMLSFREAVALFRDSTGRPGPATWELSRPPKGMERHPVAGVSWYEAAAYARFTAKSLPSVYHWNAAAQTRASHLIVPGSNFHGAGTVPIGEEGALSGFGTTDMAGNVKEWCWNETAGGKRYILGGGFGEPSYMFIDQDAQSPWERRSNYGFRCARLATPAPREALGRIDMEFRGFRDERPVSDEVFRAYTGLYGYDRTPLDARVEETETTEEWSHEKVSFAAAYGGERVDCAPLPAAERAAPVPDGDPLPRFDRDPRRTSSGCPSTPASSRARDAPCWLPDLQSTFERRDTLRSDYPEPTAFWRDHVIASSKDLGARSTTSRLGRRSTAVAWPTWA